MNEIVLESRHQELLGLISGSRLGFGCYRSVYQYLPDPTLVLKVAAERPDQNVIEHAIWKEVESVKGIAKWFAPCLHISPCGVYMLQRKVQFGLPKDYPAKIPACFTDLKYENYGFIGNQLVCCDYAGLLLSLNIGTRMKKVDWV